MQKSVEGLQHQPQPIRSSLWNSLEGFALARGARLIELSQSLQVRFWVGTIGRSVRRQMNRLKNTPAGASELYAAISAVKLNMLVAIRRIEDCRRTTCVAQTKGCGSEQNSGRNGYDVEDRRAF